MLNASWPSHAACHVICNFSEVSNTEVIKRRTREGFSSRHFAFCSHVSGLWSLSLEPWIKYYSEKGPKSFLTSHLLGEFAHNVPLSSPWPTRYSNSKSLVCYSSVDSTPSTNSSNNSPSFPWISKPRKESAAESILGVIVNTTSAPIGSYVAEPITELHKIDPRVKQIWLLALLVLPSRAGLVLRLTLTCMVALFSVISLPKPIWKDQFRRMVWICGFILIGIALGSDGVPPLYQPRSPPASALSLPPIPVWNSGYSYLLFKLGPLQLTRPGLSLGLTAACFSFIVLQSAFLCLTTTQPEQIVLALKWFFTPLRLVKLPIDEIILTLLLSLRFVGIVFDEVRNLALGVVSRGLDWKKLRFLGSVDILIRLVARLFKNLFKHVDAISQAMAARGFKGQPSEHKIFFLKDLKMHLRDWMALFLLYAFVSYVILCDSYGL